MISLVDIHINRSDKCDADASDEVFTLPIAGAGKPEHIGSSEPFGGNERRMQVRAHNHWLSLIQGNELPAVEDLKLEQLGEMASHGVLIDLTLGAASPTIIFLGERLAEECGQGLELFTIGDVPGRSLLSQLTDHCLEVAANRAPAGFDVGFADRGGRPILARGILLPFSSNGKAADFIFGVINWKQEAAPAEAAILPAPIGLTALLAQARQSALAAQFGEERSHSAFYSAISAAYDFSLAAANDPQSFDGLLQTAGLPVRPGAPLVPVVRLIFGPDYDKTRIAEISAALALGHRQRLEQGGLGELLHTTAGGLKALVAQERQFRRMASGKVAKRRHDVTPRTAAKLRNLQSISLSNQLGGGEFALFVARRDDTGGVTLIGDLSDNTPLLEAAARRLLAR